MHFGFPPPPPIPSLVCNSKKWNAAWGWLEEENQLLRRGKAKQKLGAGDKFGEGEAAFCSIVVSPPSTIPISFPLVEGEVLFKVATGLLHWKMPPVSFCMLVWAWRRIGERGGGSVLLHHKPMEQNAASPPHPAVLARLDESAKGQALRGPLTLGDRL